MRGRSKQGTLPIVELLGVEAAMLTNAEQTVGTPVVFLTFRPEPNQNWQSFSFPVSLRQAARLRDDLTGVLKQFAPKNADLANTG
jgi:hypothetical protein